MQSEFSVPRVSESLEEEEVSKVRPDEKSPLRVLLQVMYPCTHWDRDERVRVYPGCMRIHHKSRFRKTWDFATVLCLLYLILVMPVVLAFSIDRSAPQCHVQVQLLAVTCP